MRFRLMDPEPDFFNISDKVKNDDDEKGNIVRENKRLPDKKKH